MKKTILILLITILTLGCSTVPPVQPEVVTEKFSLEDGLKPSSGESTIWWLVIFHNDQRRPIHYWVIKDDSFTFIQDSRSVAFKDPDSGVNVILKENYSFTIIRMGEWYHPDFTKDEEPAKDIKEPKIKDNGQPKVFCWLKKS